MPKVLISDALSPLAAQIFKDRGIEVDFKPGLKADELLKIIGDYDGLAVRSETKVKPPELFAAARKLKVIGRAGIGVDNIDIPAATSRGIVVMNTPFGNSVTTAEHAVMYITALARDLATANASTRAGKWEKTKFMGVELTGKTLGVIGCGNIGSNVAERAQGLKMKVIAYDPFLTPERAAKLGVEKADELDQLFQRADFITLHTPLTEKTKGLIDAASLAKCKKGVYIINCARGGLVNEVDLQAALESGQVAGAGLDVFAVEPPPADHPLLQNPKVICTPHLGASTTEAQVKVALQVAEQMSDYLLTGAVTNALNMPSVSAEDAPKLRPYLRLAEQMGSFAGQIASEGMTEVAIEYEGEATRLNVTPMTSALLMGLLQPAIESVNMVNASSVAKERGIAVKESKNTAEGDFHTLIRLRITSPNALFTLAGSLFSGKPRIVNIDGVEIDGKIFPRMLFVRNHDKPGAVAGLTAALAAANINIADLQLGRVAAGEDAVALIGVDSEVSAPMRKQIEALPHMVSVHGLKFSNGG